MAELGKVKLALVQFGGELCESAEPIERNVAHACELIAEAGERGADLVVFPELFTTGYQLNVIGPHINELTEPEDGPSVTALRKAAADAGVYVVAGIALFHGLTGVPYNSSVVIDRDGNLIATYDKQHLWALERFYFRGGDDSLVFQTDFGKVGIMICYDMGFPEVARTLTLRGADLIVCPSAWCAEDMDVWHINAPCRALENSVFLAAVTRSGEEQGLVMPGHSRVCNPRGGIIDELQEPGEAILYVDIDLGEVEKNRVTSPYLRDRRPELYEDVLL